MGKAKRRREMRSGIPEIGLIPYLLHRVEFGKALCTVALEGAEADVGLTISPTGCGYCTELFRAAIDGDPKATIVTNAIAVYLQRLLGPPPTPNECLICCEALHTAEREVSIVVATYAAVPVPSSVCCAPICMMCWRAFPEPEDLLHQIMERFRVFLPDLHLVHVAAPGHA